MSVVHEFAVLPLVLNGHPARPQAALEQMFSRDSTRAAADQWTAADFWHHTTEGAVQLRPQYLAPVFLAGNDVDWVAVNAAVNDGAGAQAASLVRRLVAESVIRAVPTIVLLSHGGLADTAICYRVELQLPLPNGKSETLSRSVVHLSTVDSQSLICHELGHALGFDHPLGVVSNQGGQDTTEYGSPYCVMGTASRWGQVSVTRTPWAGSQVPAGDGFWTNGGPGLSRAALINWGWDREVDLTWARQVPWAEATSTQVLGDRGSGAKRAIVYGSFDDQCIVAELRRPLPTHPPDYDAALSFDFVRDNDLYDGPGVVVHEIRNLSGVGRRCFYLGTIPVPGRGVGDLEIWGSGGRRLRLVSVDGDRVQISMSAASPVTGSFVELTVALEARRRPHTEVGRRVPTLRALPYRVGLTGPDCTTNTFWGSRVDEQVTVHVLARAFGIDLAGLHDRPEFTWRVAGVGLTPARLDGSPVGATILTTAEVDVPSVGEFHVWHPEQRTVELQARANWASLAVDCPPGDGRYDVSIEVTVGPQPGVADGRLPSASATVNVPVETQRIAFGAGLAEATAACSRYMEELVNELPETRVGVVLKKVLAGPLPGVNRRTGALVLDELAVNGDLSKLRRRLPDLGKRNRPT